MTNTRIFLEAFMDGFTMSGFMSRLEQPGVLPLLAEEEPDGISDLLLEHVHDLPVQKIEQLIHALSEEIRTRQAEGVPANAG